MRPDDASTRAGGGGKAGRGVARAAARAFREAGARGRKRQGRCPAADPISAAWPAPKPWRCWAVEHGGCDRHGGGRRRGGLPSIGTAILLNRCIGQREGTCWRPDRSSTVVALNARTRSVVNMARMNWRGDASSSTHLLIYELTSQPWAASTFRHRFAAVRAAAAQALPESADLLI
jgi:hypothetical protein